MSTIDIWLLAFGLAMDCFTVSIASGIILRRFEWRPILLMAFFFGFFQALMPFISWSLFVHVSGLVKQVDHWIALALLGFLGINMIRESFSDEEEKHLFNPRKLTVILTMAVATSIDALAVGISFACTSFSTLRNIAFPLFAIGLVSFMLSLCGSALGIISGRRIARRLHPELLGGIILIAIGCKILVQHLTLGL